MSKFAGPASNATQAAAPEPPPPPAYGAAAMVDILEQINWNGCEVLNAVKKDSLGNALKQGLRDQEGLLVESDADEQLLITLSFKTKVKLHSISVAGPGGRAPKEIKLFANKSNLGFDDVEGMPADQTLELAPEQLGERTELKFVKFQNVDFLTIFIASNQDDEESTALSSLVLYGTTVATTNMGEFKRVAGEKGEGE